MKDTDVSLTSFHISIYIDGQQCSSQLNLKANKNLYLSEHYKIYMSVR